MVPDRGVKDQEVSTSSSPAATEIARAGRPPRPVSLKRFAAWDPIKHRRFRAWGTKKIAKASSTAQAVAGAREVGDATTAVAAMRALMESGRDDEKGQVWGGWKR